MKNIIKNIKNAVVNFFISILLIILFILKGANYIFTCFFQDWTFALVIILIICVLCYPV